MGAGFLPKLEEGVTAKARRMVGALGTGCALVRIVRQNSNWSPLTAFFPCEVTNHSNSKEDRLTGPDQPQEEVDGDKVKLEKLWKLMAPRTKRFTSAGRAFGAEEGWTWLNQAVRFGAVPQAGAIRG